MFVLYDTGDSAQLQNIETVHLLGTSPNVLIGAAACLVFKRDFNICLGLQILLNPATKMLNRFYGIDF